MGKNAPSKSGNITFYNPFSNIPAKVKIGDVKL